MSIDKQLIKEMDKLRRFAMRLTKNEANADDLLQNTMLRAYEKQHLFEEGSNLFSWTSKIMYNLFVSEYRRKVKFESQYDPEPIINREAAVIDYDDQMMVNEVGEAMQCLSDDHKNIIIMVCVQGMKYKETAEKLGIPVGTVRSRLSRARDLLFDIMDDRDGDAGFSIMPKDTQSQPSRVSA